MAELRKLIFVDTETTGLDPATDKLVELSYAQLGEPIKTLYFGVEEVPDFIDGLIKFTERGIAGIKSRTDEVGEFINLSEKQTMVAANPGFDRGFLEANKLYHFGYRMLDIETYAMAVLGINYVPSMKEIFGLLSDRGYTLPEPDHTSAGDVATMMEAFEILTALNKNVDSRKWVNVNA